MFLPRARTAALAVLILCAAGAGPGHAQEEAPAAEPEAASPAAKPKPKPKPKAAAPKPAEKPAEAAAKPAEAAKAVWPAGADTVSETYGEWTVNCGRGKERIACLVIQAQGDSKSGRRQFAIELFTPREGRAEGTVLMPFGLAIEPGVTFKLDEAILGKGAYYVSCSAEGCLVPISFPTPATDAMRTAKTLTVSGQKPGGEALTLTVPLAGFGAAFDRAAAFGS